VGLLRRAARLVAIMAKDRPQVLLSSSRSSAIAARMLGIPAFVVCDYEHVDLDLYRRLGTTLLFPDVIPEQVFVDKGFAPDALMPFEGLKEDLTFAAVDVEGPEAYRAPVDAALVRILFRPPAEESHYYSAASGDFARALIEHLARQRDAVTLFSPRYEWQTRLLDGVSWANEPVVLDRPVPFVPLLKGSDMVICSGGTMLREAAYLGVPAYSIFRGELGAVDRHLADSGRVTLLATAEDLDRLRIAKRTGPVLAKARPDHVDSIAERILARAQGSEPGRSGTRR
jgi:predicted glycosyltransferase